MTQRLFYTSWYDVCSTPNISTNHLVVFGVVVITHSEIEKNKNKNKSKMAAEGESLSDSQSKVSNASDELTSLESSISDSDSDSKNNNKRLQFFSICWKEKNSSAECHNKEQQKKRKTRTKKKTADKGIILLEMDELSSWVFSSKEAKKLESPIRQRLRLDSPCRIASRVRRTPKYCFTPNKRRTKEQFRTSDHWIL